MRFLVATKNLGKLREYQTLLADFPIEWVSLQEIGLGDMRVAETGTTLTANACLKARAYADASGLPTLADDTGLEVDALGGAPGVYSARYGGPNASDADRYRKLLAELGDTEARGARFRCVIAIATPGGDIQTAEGKCEGYIARAPRGTNGFGYDAVFVVEARGVTMAELTEAEKNTLSHRARALEAARPILARRLEAQGK